MTSMDTSLSFQESENSSSSSTAKKKALLVRSNAFCGDDDTKNLRPSTQQCSGNSQQLIGTANSMPAMGVVAVPRGSSGRMRTKHCSNTPSLSRDSSIVTATAGDYCTDSTGIYLLQFIDSTLHKNAKDREMLLNLEVEMRKFVLDTSKQAYKFPKMSSYNRMLVHRVAAFFGLDHNIDQTGTVVVVNKTPNTRLPDIEFRCLIKNNLYTDRMLHNRRNVQSFDECRLTSLYGNYHPGALANIQQQQQPFVAAATANSGSATLHSTVGPNYPPLSSSLDIIRRARSFEVGEWQNSMAVMSGPGGMAPGTVPFSASSSRHHRLSGGSTNSTCSSVNWQQQQQFHAAGGRGSTNFHSPGLEGLGLGFVAGSPYAAPPPKLYQQSSFSSSRPESLASLHSRKGRFGSGECVLDQQSGYNQVRSRQLSSNSSNQPITSSPITGQLATLAISPNNHIKQSQDFSFEAGGVLLKNSSAEAASEENVIIDPTGQVPQNHYFLPPPTYPCSEGFVPPAPKYRMDMSYSGAPPQYMAAPPPNNYSYEYVAPASTLQPAYSPVVYVPTSGAYVQVFGSPQYYVGGVGMHMAAPATLSAPYQQAMGAYGSESEQHSSFQHLSDQYQHSMNISSDSGTQCSPLQQTTNGQMRSYHAYQINCGATVPPPYYPPPNNGLNHQAEVPAPLLTDTEGAATSSLGKASENKYFDMVSTRREKKGKIVQNQLKPMAATRTDVVRRAQQMKKKQKHL